MEVSFYWGYESCINIFGNHAFQLLIIRSFTLLKVVSNAIVDNYMLSGQMRLPQNKLPTIEKGTSNMGAIFLKFSKGNTFLRLYPIWVRYRPTFAMAMRAIYR